MKRTLTLAVIQPSFIAALFGPHIISVYLSMLRGNIDFPYGAVASGGAVELKTAISAPFSYALIDLGVQLSVLFVAWLLLLSDVVTTLYLCNRRKSRQLGQYFQSFRDGWFWFVFIILVLFVFFVLFGGAASPDVVSHYLPERSVYLFGSIRFPPYNSVVTWGRLVVIGVGFWWVFVKESRLSLLLR